MHTRHAIVVGASSGIGKEIALLLISKGYSLGVAARRVEKLQQLKDLAPDRVEVGRVDVTAPDATSQFQHLLDLIGGKIDLLVYAAGIGFQNVNLDPEVELKTTRTNVQGFTRIVTYVYRHMVEQGHGHIACITSIAGTKGLGAAPAYSATKAFQNTYLQALEQQTAIRKLKGIRFTDIRPGFVDTALLDGDNSYPLLMKPDKVARHIVSAIEKRRHVYVIDGRWRVITAMWRRIPRWLWRKLRVAK